jgi:hypothetical protein
MIQDHCYTRSGSWDGVTRAGRDLLTYLALISLGASGLAACTGQWPYSPWQAEPAPAVPAPGPTVPFSPPGPAASLPSDVRAANSSRHQSSELVGLDQPEVTRVLGAAAEQFEQPPAMVWRYKNAACELDLFFYLDLHSNRMRTLHYAVKGDGGDPARRQDCVRSLRVARSD